VFHSGRSKPNCAIPLFNQRDSGCQTTTCGQALGFVATDSVTPGGKDDARTDSDDPLGVHCIRMIDFCRYVR
jgi:hypothetical protein